MRKLVVIVLTLAVLGCQSTSSVPKASDAELEQAEKAYVQCLIQEIPKFDDKMSDASVIAEAVMKGPCHPQSQTVIEVLTRGSNDRVKQMYSDHFYAQSGKETAIQVVLRERAG